MNIKKIVFLFFLSINIVFTGTTIYAIDFSVATGNVLYDLSYLKYYYGSEPVDMRQRIASFNREMNNLKQRNTDIICFQEWLYKEPGQNDFAKSRVAVDENLKSFKVFTGSAKELGNREAEEISSAKDLASYRNHEQAVNFNNIIQQLFVNNGYQKVECLPPTEADPEAVDGSLILFNSQKFNLLETHRIVLDKAVKKKAALLVKLQPKDDASKVVWVLSVHFPVFLKFPVRYENEIVGNLTEIMRRYTDPANDNHWIICGDFNSEVFDANRRIEIDLPNKVALTDVTSRIPKDPKLVTGVEWNGDRKRYDYMFYSSNIGMIPGSQKIIPENSGQLIRHEQNFKEPYVYPENNPYFSDHATLFARFRLK